MKQIAEWTEEFAQLPFVCFPPWLYISNSDNDVVVHLFTDASERGYGCCIYFVIRSISHLVFAKAKVAPVKTQTIARLELQAAFLGARYLSLAIEKSRVLTRTIHVWTDSMTTITILTLFFFSSRSLHFALDLSILFIHHFFGT